MTGNNATDAVIGSVIVITGSTAIKNAANGTFHMSSIVAGFLLGSALLLVAMASPALAKGLALLGVVGAITTNGPAVFKIVGGIK